MQFHSFISRPRECSLIARDVFVRMNRRAIAMTFVLPSLCLSVWDEPLGVCDWRALS